MNLLVWIDCEMSGLNPENNHILELAVVITDINSLEPIASKEIIINHDENILTEMDDWNTDQHKKSGLWDKVLKSSCSYSNTESELIEFLSNYTQKKCVHLAGNSVYHDLAFLKIHLPKVANWMHYRIVDISSLKVLIQAWYSEKPDLLFNKKNNHRALDDIYESIAELKYYKNNFFIS